MSGPRSSALRALTRMAGGIVVFGVLFFGVAGTFAYWQAWAWLAAVLVPMALLLVRLVRRDPALLERRLRMRERRSRQRVLIVASNAVLLLAFVVPGLDRRFGWSHVPVGVVLAADAAVVLGYALFARVLTENRYAARTVEIEPGHELVTTGMYRLVRHPMYLAVLIMYAATPVALGSWWALLPVVLLPVVLAARIHDEERMLVDELPGYRDYQARTRFRLVPGVW